MFSFILILYKLLKQIWQKRIKRIRNDIIYYDNNYYSLIYKNVYYAFMHIINIKTNNIIYYKTIMKYLMKLYNIIIYTFFLIYYIII